MNIFNHFAKSIIAGHQGKLNTFPNGYKFSDEGCTNAQGVHLKAKPDASGRMISLSLGVKTVNGCPQPPPGDWPQNDRGRYWVPFNTCRKCEHHLKRRRGQPYPCCAILRKLASQGPSPAETVAKVMQNAANQAAEILK